MSLIQSSEKIETDNSGRSLKYEGGFVQSYHWEGI